jgi:2',3'-cyclic-nucleotide 2'-phosphodiesterase / 3'-nucleotidase
MTYLRNYLILMLISLSGFQAVTAEETTHIKIIVTTDVHGHVLPYDVLAAQPRSHSLAQVHTYVMKKKARDRQHVVLLDNGDILQGDPLMYYYNFVDTSGIHPVAGIMNYMGYEASVVGNHDVEAGHAVYDKLVDQFDFPWLAANIIDETTGLSYFKPYTIIERGNIRIAVLGLTTPSVPNWLPEELWGGMHFEDMLLSARNWVKYIKRNEKPDLLIGLFHSGAPKVSFPDGPPALLENASRVIAERVEGFDVIFSGHDHRRWNEFIPNATEGHTLLLGGGSNARSIAVADIRITKNESKKSRSVEVKGKIVDMTDLPAHAEFMNEFQDLKNPVQAYVNTPVTVLNDTLSSRYALFGSAGFVNLIHQIQLELSGAEVSFSAPLSFDAVIPAGTITRGDLFKLYRYENQLYTMKLSGKEIHRILEYSYSNWFNHMQNPGDHLLNFVKDEKNEIIINPYGRPQTATPYFNFESAAGIAYTVDVSKPAGERVKITGFINGNAFKEEQSYNVAINSYRASGGGGHLTEGALIPHDEIANRITWTSGIDLRYMIMNYLSINGPPAAIKSVDWKVIPEAWQQSGKEKDYEILFGK